MKKTGASFTVFVLPDLATHLFPYILLPCLIGELSVALWLVIKGIRVDRFEAWSST